MIEFYPQVKLIHVAMVVASGSLFALRGVGVLMGSPIGMSAPVRYLSYSIDTTLFTAALMLATMLHQYPFVHGWLTAKVLLLVAYIVLGSYALKRAATIRVRLICFAAAVLIYLLIATIALTRGSITALPGLLS
jgi:uncharacterized membrane protein SirB2